MGRSILSAIFWSVPSGRRYTWHRIPHTVSVGLKHRQVGGIVPPALLHLLPHLYDKIVLCYFLNVTNLINTIYFYMHLQTHCICVLVFWGLRIIRYFSLCDKNHVIFFNYTISIQPCKATLSVLAILPTAIKASLNC